MHPALCQPRTGQRNWGPNFPNSSTSVQPRINDIKFLLTSPASASAVCEHPAALCPSGGSARHRTSAVQRSWPAQLGHHSAKVSRERLVYLWDAIPPGIVPFLPLTLFKKEQGSARQKSHKAFRAPRVRPPEGPLAQRVPVSIPQGAPCCQPHPVPVAPSVQRHWQYPPWLPSLRISAVAVVLQFHCPCM